MMIFGYKSVLVKLFHLLVYADGNLNEKEIEYGLLAARQEGISEPEFMAFLESLKKRSATAIYMEAVDDLRKQPRAMQIRCVAWLCLIANADGFMDKTEWQFIYKLYNTELKLPLDEILKMQKGLMTTKPKKNLLSVAL